jgi:hypothetical protein
MTSLIVLLTKVILVGHRPMATYEIRVINYAICSHIIVMRSHSIASNN